MSEGQLLISQVFSILNESFEVGNVNPEEKKEKGPRFYMPSTDEVNAMKKNKNREGTESQTKWAVRVFKDWLMEVGEDCHFEQTPADVLSVQLEQFYTVVKTKTGEMYSKSAMRNLRAGLQRHLAAPPHNRNINITYDREFRQSNVTYAGYLAKLRSDGLDKPTPKEMIQPEDIEKLYTHAFTDDPKGLQHRIFFQLMLHYGRRGRHGLRPLKKDSFRIEKDRHGAEYVAMSPLGEGVGGGEKTRRRWGVKENKADAAEKRMYGTPDDPSRCPVIHMRKYLSKLHPASPWFFQHPKKYASVRDEVWYDKAPLGVNALSNMMKHMSEKAKLSRPYTNLCIHRTCVGGGAAADSAGPGAAEKAREPLLPGQRSTSSSVAPCSGGGVTPSEVGGRRRMSQTLAEHSYAETSDVSETRQSTPTTTTSPPATESQSSGDRVDIVDPVQLRSPDCRQELRKVNEELAQVEKQLETLLEHQAALLSKRRKLEAAIKDAEKAPSSIQNRNWAAKDFKWSKALDEARDTIFKVKAYRPLQLEAMNATLSKQDCFLIMPTGGGKSLCFQLPAVISKGITLVVSPLVSLMEDQLMGLKELGVNATMLNASSTREEVNSVHAEMTASTSKLKLLYVTPEKLAKSKRFMNKLEKMYEAGRFTRLVIDEVHCCSQWGHDFRPDYKFLGVMRRQFPGVPILGLTATATSTVITDVKKILGVTDCLQFRASFNRKNLFYEVRQKPPTLKNAMDDMAQLIKTRFPYKPGIIYCFSRKDSEDVTRELQQRALAAGCYHADMDARERSATHRKWMRGSLQIVVATIAFGMGIDKANVRFVIHHSMSKSMENYYQESGRAGRDDETAYCILYRHFADVFRQSCMVFTEQTGLEKLYSMVAYAFDAGTCRRTLIAKHFGEQWDSDQCSDMCDHCRDKEEAFQENIAKMCQDVVRLIEHAQATKQRVTALKVLEAWQGQGARTLRVKSVPKPPARYTRTDIERLLAQMLLLGYLREDFHFTPYSTISYLLPGHNASLLKSSDHLVLVRSPAKTVLAQWTLSAADSESTEFKTDGASLPKKRKARVIESESEGSDADFDDAQPKKIKTDEDEEDSDVMSSYHLETKSIKSEDLNSDDDCILMN